MDKIIYDMKEIYFIAKNKKRWWRSLIIGGGNV
jgi:hypothetical protein